MTDTERDVVDLLSADHREFDRIFQELEQLAGRTGEEAVEPRGEDALPSPPCSPWPVR